MSRLWPAESLAFEESVQRAMESTGAIEFARACERDPTQRSLRLAGLFSDLGLDELAVDEGEVEAAAAALAARAAGRVIAPWPLVQRLTASIAAVKGVTAVYLTSGSPRRVDHLDVAGPSIAIDVLSGASHSLVPAGEVAYMPLDPFGVPCQLGAPVDTPAGAASTHIVLSAFWALGAIETAVSASSVYAVERFQFGRPIGSFGAVQWRLADLSVARSALLELAGFTLAKLCDGTVTLADALALRLQMLESCELVLENAHQVFGAIGLCDEHDLSVIDRHLQSLLRRPLGKTQTVHALSERVTAEGFDLLYPVRPHRGAERSIVLHAAASSGT